MPNGTLCGKAVVELLLADAEDVPAADAQKKVVKEVTVYVLSYICLATLWLRSY